MHNAKYLIRIDDICEGFNVANFYRLIEIFTKFNVKPVIAVIPLNRDKRLIFPKSIYGEIFWKLIYKLEKELKWKVGIHGYEHHYVTNDSGLLKINNFSEFAGLSYSEQYFKIKNAVKIMKTHKISSDLFIAPGHSFDKNTLKILKDIGIKSISDGFYNYPGKDKNGLFWIPQQLWNFSLKNSGVWTINLHINEWQDSNFNDLKKNLTIYKGTIVDYKYVIDFFNKNKLDHLDHFLNKLRISKHKMIRDIVRFRDMLDIF